MKKGCKALYISYNGLLEEIVPSQVIPYIRELAKAGYSFILLTFEKKERLKAAGKKELARLKDELGRRDIDWRWLQYHKRMPLLATSFDVLMGAAYASYLIIIKRIRIVHSRSVVPAAMGLVSKLFGAKFIFDTRGILADEYVGGGHWKEWDLKYNITKFFDRTCLGAADAVVVLTERHRRYLSEASFYETKAHIVETIPCCVDLDRFKYSVNTSREGLADGFIFLYQGKIGKHYMLDEMLDFFMVASMRMPHSRFVILTPGDKDQVWDGVLKKDLDPTRVTVQKPRFEEIPCLISQADVGIFFINPYKKFGSSPIKLGEFLSCGIPVIINSGIGDTEELVRSNNVGVVVNRFDCKEYHDGLDKLFELIKEGESLGRRCRITAEKYLSLEMGVRRYNAIYSRFAHV